MAQRLVPQRWVEPVLTGDPIAGKNVDYPAGNREDSVLGIAMEGFSLLRRHWILVSVITAGAVGLVVLQIRREPPVFRAAAVIRLTDKSRAMSGGLAGNTNERLVGAVVDPIQSELQVLQSRVVAREIAEEQGLRLQSPARGFSRQYLDSVSVGANAPRDSLRLSFDANGYEARYAGSVARAAFGQAVALNGVRFVITAPPGVPSVRLSVVPLDAAANQVIGGLRSRVRERTDVVDVSFDAADPMLAQRTVNAAVQVFKEASARTAKQESNRRRQFIEQQLAKVEAELADAEAQHNRFQSRQQTYSTQEKFKAQQSDLTGLEVRRQELSTDRQIYSNLLASLDSVSSGPLRDDRLNAIVSSPGIGTNPVIAQLFGEVVRLRRTRDSLTSGQWAASPSNPDVRRLDDLTTAAQGSLVSAIRGQISAVEARLSALDAVKARSSAQLAKLPPAQAEESNLLAQVQTHQREAERLRDELQKAQIEEAAQNGKVETIDLAVLPAGPVASARTSKVLFALLVGLGLGGVAAYILENYGAVIRKREELERATAAPNLAVIPKIKSLADANGRAKSKLLRRSTPENRPISPIDGPAELVTVNDARSNSAEAYRTLRTNIMFSAAVQTLRCVVVTSAGASEGKSTTAANLAVAFAQQGHRVLLVDCDLRRPRVHTLFGVRQEPGLTNVLLGRTSLAESKQATMVPNLELLTAGPLPPNPVELLGSQAMHQLVDNIPDVDLVVLDTPPLLVASDAAVLGRNADGVIMVVRAGQTQRGAVLEAVQQLAAVNARIIGTVLNDPDSEAARYSSYHQYYSSEYYKYSEAR